MKCKGYLKLKYLAPPKNLENGIFHNFLNLTYQLQIQYSQLPNDQNAKFLCLSDAEFPEFLETGLTFYHCSFLGVIYCQKNHCTFFLGYHVIGLTVNATRNLIFSNYRKHLITPLPPSPYLGPGF